MTVERAAVLSAAATSTWRSSAAIDEDDPRLDVLVDFCAVVDAGPDELIDRCLRDVGDGQFRIRMAARRQLAEQIADYQGGDQQRGNVVRSFFIHNGVSLQPPTILK